MPGSAAGRDTPLVVRGGTVYTPAGPVEGDVLVRGGRIEAVGPGLAGQAGETVDASGCLVLPGMIDVHVHAADTIAGVPLADGWASVSRAALPTGITTLAGFVTQQRGETVTAALDRALGRVRGQARCRVAFHLTPTSWPWDWEEAAALVDRGYGTFKVYTTYREAGLYLDYRRLREVMARLGALGARLLVHCEDDAVLAGAARGGADPARAASHPRLRPPEAEVEAIRRVVELAAETGCRTHVVHVSTDQGARLVAAARTRAPVSCETAPHYLALDGSWLEREDGHRWLCTPPLRSAATRAALLGIVRGGGVDLLATDHCAFTCRDKDAHRGDARRVPRGVAGAGALAPLAFALLPGAAAVADLVRLLAEAPARLLGVFPRRGAVAPGADADLVVLRPGGPPRPVVSTVADAPETYPGFTSTSDVRAVLLGGATAVRDGVLLPGPAPL